MRVLALVPYPVENASTRYRIAQFVPALAARGMEVTLAPFMDSGAYARLYERGGAVQKGVDWWRAAGRRKAQVDAAADYDAVFVLRALWPLRAPRFEPRLLARNPRFVFDLDDAIFLPHVSEANRRAEFLKAPQNTDWLAAHAASVSAGNAFLGHWAEGHKGTGARVFDTPTAIDTDTWRPAPDGMARADTAPRLGWIGTHSTMPFLEALAPALLRLRQDYPALRLTVIGATSTRLGDMVDVVPWSAATEVKALDAIDIGLAPLPDTDWSRGKCGLKVLQYMALAKPVVASPVGVHPAMIESGVHGLFATDEDAWVQALRTLLADAALRRTMGAAGRARVEERYSVRAVAPRLGDALAWAAGRP